MKKLILLILVNLIVYKSYSQLLNSENKPAKKVALVIGVANYEYANSLKNTLNDANDMASHLANLGFEVHKLLDPDKKTLTYTIDSFGNQILTADVCLFYYSGHGAEYQGENFLFPKDSKPIIPNDLYYEAYPLGKILGKIEFSKINTSLIVLDACRSNPFTKSWSRGENIYEGLANINYAPNGTFIGFAASPGKVASDGTNRNGTYTEAILKFIDNKNISIDELFNKVNKEVRKNSRGKQIPYKSSTLEDNFYFNQDLSILNADSANGNISKSEYQLAVLNRPKFPWPKSDHSYSLAAVNSYASLSINQDSFKSDEFIDIYISLIGENIWDKTTPVYVSLVQKKDQNQNGGIIRFSDEFQPISRNSRIRISSSVEPGNYELRVGFYFISELDGEYPPYFTKSFQIVIR